MTRFKFVTTIDKTSLSNEIISYNRLGFAYESTLLRAPNYATDLFLLL